MSYDNKDSAIERLFEGLSDYEVGLFNSGYEKYLTSIRENKIRRENVFLKKLMRKRSE